ncbi:MAG: CHAD domain-containing protein [Chloroflexia bacterium]
METEAKFTVPGEAAFARLRGTGQFGSYERREERTKEVHDRYLDTPALSFLNNGWSLRLRKGKAGDLLITIKGLERHALGDESSEGEAGGIHSRQEYETSVPGLAISRWPASEAKQLARGLAAGQPLRDLVSVGQTRTVSLLYDGERAVAELSLDEVAFHSENKQDDASPTAYELEAELLPDGTLADLRALSRIFSEEYGLDAQPRSKFEQALHIAGLELRSTNDRVADLDGTPKARKRPHQPPTAPHEPTPPSLEAPPTPTQPELHNKPIIRNPQSAIRNTDSMALAGRKLIAHHFEAMLANEEGARLGEDPEAVHDMRVATRRMRAVMRVFGSHLKSKKANDVRSGLRAVAGALGAVRDLDVLIGNVDAFRETLSPDRQAGLPSMLEEWRVRRWKARKALLRLLDSKEYSRFKRGMDRFLEEDTGPPDQSQGARPYQVRHVIGSAIISRYEEVRAFEALQDEPTMAQVHALRIVGKYFRYTLEFFRDVLPKDASAMIRDVIKLQDGLGELHDADVATTLVRDYLDGRKGQGPGARDHGPGNGHTQIADEGIPTGLATYLAELQSIIDTKRKEYVATWTTLHSQEWRKRLAALLVRDTP